MFSWTVPVALVVVVPVAVKERCSIAAPDEMVDSSSRCPSWRKLWLFRHFFGKSLLVRGLCGCLLSCTASSPASGPSTKLTRTADLSSSSIWQAFAFLVFSVAKDTWLLILACRLMIRSGSCLFAFFEGLGDFSFGFQISNPATAALIVYSLRLLILLSKLDLSLATL